MTFFVDYDMRAAMTKAVLCGAITGIVLPSMSRVSAAPAAMAGAVLGVISHGSDRMLVPEIGPVPAAVADGLTAATFLGAAGRMFPSLRAPGRAIAATSVALAVAELMYHVIAEPAPFHEQDMSLEASVQDMVNTNEDEPRRDLTT